MSILDITGIKSEVRAALGGRTDTDDRLIGALNLSQMRLARLHDFDELRSIIPINTAVTASAAADKVISLSTLGRYRKIYTIRLYAPTTQQSRKLRKVLPKRWDKLIPEPEYYSRGTPTDYMTWGKDQIELWKVPDAVYSLYFRYSRWPTILAANAAAEFLDLENVDDLIIHLTLSYINMSLGNMEKAAEYYKIYAALAKEALNEDEDTFDMDMMAHDQSRLSRSLGYNDPFVRSTSEFGE